MSRLLDIQHRIQDTDALLHKLERAIAEHPDSRSIASDIRSLTRRRDSLMAEFQYVADVQTVDVCSYRLFKDAGARESIDIMGFSSALRDFQELVSITFDAMKNGAKQRRKIGAEVIKATQFDFGFAFAGSLGVVMTVPNTRLLGDMQTVMDEAINAVFSMAQAQSTKEILEFSKVLGPPTVRALYKWSKDHADDSLGAEIKWQRMTDVRDRVQVGLEQMNRLRDILSSASEDTTTDVTIEGVLVGADVVRQRFKFAPESGGLIEGSASGIIDSDHQVTMPSRYRIVVRKTVSIKYATDKEEVTWRLLQKPEILV